MTATKGTPMTQTAAELRQMAAAAELRVQESWERSDTDGFLSQWAGGLTAEKYRLQAEIQENGGRSEFAALFDLDGNLIAAKLIETTYGTSWALLESDDPRSRIIGWVNRSHAAKETTRNRNMAKKGYSEGTILAPAKADITGRGTGLSGTAWVTTIRTDGGFSDDVEIVSTTDARGDW